MKRFTGLLVMLMMVFVLILGGCNKSTTMDTHNTTLATTNASSDLVVVLTPNQPNVSIESNDFEKNTYRTIVTMDTMFNVLMETGGSLYKEKMLTDSSRLKLEALGNIYYGAHQALVLTFETYKKVQDEDSKLALALQFYKTVKNYNEVLDCYNDVTKGIKGVQQWTKL